MGFALQKLVRLGQNLPLRAFESSTALVDVEPPVKTHEAFHHVARWNVVGQLLGAVFSLKPPDRRLLRQSDAPPRLAFSLAAKLTYHSSFWRPI